MQIVFLSTLACLLGIVIVTWLHARRPLDVVVRPVPLPATAPLISVCVPARNEARNIQRCCEALLAQTYPNFELLVIDDRSTDGTLQILTALATGDARLRAVQGEELPAGWAGKPHALFQASGQARGEWLCFVDADTFIAPQGLASAYVAAQSHQADLFTMMTEQELGSFWEKVILPLVFTGLTVGFVPRKVNDPTKPDAIANGQFILIKRSVYEAVGGHAAIRDSIVEDKDLAVLVKHAGYRLVVADGRAVARTRMYTTLPEMWEGWTKNIFLGLKGSAGLLLLGAFGAFVSLWAALLLPLGFAAGLAWWAAAGWGGGLLIALEAAVLAGYLVFRRARVCRQINISAWYALTVPLGAAVFAGMMAASAWKVLSGQGVTWKGRKYASRA
ncbi:MAG: glycosyltransferase [Anaerolineales bacterium]